MKVELGLRQRGGQYRFQRGKDMRYVPAEWAPRDGGDIEAGSLVDEQWLLDLERRHFMELLATQKTQARIEHMLKTGKPLRN